MADEIRVNSTIAVKKGSFDITLGRQFNVDQTGDGGGNPGKVAIGTTEEVVALGDITTIGWAYIQNIDATNYVQWGPESGGAMVVAGRLEAGEGIVVRLEPSTTYRMKADTAACDVILQVFED